MKLLLVESPTKARTIGKYLGKSFKVIATKGHIIDLPKSRMGIDLDNFDPEYITIRGKGKLLSSIKTEVKNVDEVYLATDNDREGEAIAWHLSNALNLKNIKNRIEFNEITKKSITDAIKNPREINMNLVNSQQARRVLDRVVGYSISPILWKKIKGHLSAGRVQSVALKIICERENQIRDFVPEEYWNIKGIFDINNEKIQFDLTDFIDSGKIKKINISNEVECNSIINELNANEYKFYSINSNIRKRKPNPPFTTSTLQQECNKRFGLKSSNTMQIAQTLYEGKDVGSGSVGLITYMRTDSTRISDEALSSCKQFILDKYGDEYFEGNKKYSKSKGKIQDAHEAIRPTDVFRTPSKIRSYLTDAEFKVYKLIWERFVASQMSDSKILNIKVSIINGNYIFKKDFEKIVFDGFSKLYGIDIKELEIDINNIKENEKVNCVNIEKQQNFTKPPHRYTEATIIKKLEEEGVGRPSTYAPTISLLMSRNYIKIEEKTLKPTELGELVNRVVSDSFPSIVDLEFTKNMENILDDIAEGEKDWKKVLSSFYSNFKNELNDAEKQEKIDIKYEESDEICELCGRRMVIKDGRYGKFLACPGFPECKNTKPLIEKSGVKCPKCKTGDIIKKRSKTGRIFYGCSNYPECDFIMSNKPIDKKCPECGNLLSEKKLSKKTIIKCEKCNYKEEKNNIEN